MSGETTAPVGDGVDSIGSGVRRNGRRRMLFAVVLALIAAGVIVVISGRFPPRGGNGSGSGDNGYATSLATIERQSLSTQTHLNATLGYAGSYTVLGRLPGTVTWLPTPGQVIGNGQPLYRVNGSPVVLLSGSTPAYRRLAAGASAADVTGADVEQLNHDLVALGDANLADIDAAWDQFSSATTAGVQQLQKHLGVEQTGTLDLGTTVFLPTSARVTTLSVSLGAQTPGPVLMATSTARTVSVALDVGLQSKVKVGDQVTISLPDNSTTPGTVTAVGKVATTPSNGSGSSDSQPTVPVIIQPTDPTATGSLDQAPVVVSITDQTVPNVLAAPVDALLALAGGGYAVEVVASDGTHHLVRVTPGLFDDAAGLVQLSGSGLAAGQRVVVPGNV